MAESTQKNSKNVTAPTPWPVATLIILAILDMANGHMRHLGHLSHSASHGDVG